ncbi:hypothetical protein TNCV_3959651 [Trichonephila clavipes]|nr:hypothetical protein TNCV_3959651 [Trichonephila clavipes]
MFADSVGSPLQNMGGKLFNGSTSIRSNAYPQPSLTFVIYSQWCTTFGTLLISDSPILPSMVQFYHVGMRTVHKLSRL